MLSTTFFWGVDIGALVKSPRNWWNLSWRFEDINVTRWTVDAIGLLRFDETGGEGCC